MNESSSLGYSGTLRGTPRDSELYPRISQDYIDKLDNVPVSSSGGRLSLTYCRKYTPF